MHTDRRHNVAARVEWPTLALIAACYALWGATTVWAASIGLLPAIALTALAITLHSSLSHEVLHGHPLPDQRVNAALVFPALGLFVPYERFRDTHLAHHRDETLTDPYDDPESNYLDPAVWRRLPGPLRALLSANNTLAGRMILGPAIGLARFYRDDLRLALAGDRGVPRAWALHAAGLLPVIAWLGWASTMPAWAYLAAAYLGLSVLKIRTFLEHRAHDTARGRSVIIEDRGPLALLFLNNNLHAVHHGHPGLAWYDLPGFYRRHRGRFLRKNGHYFYRSYWEVFARHFLRRKDPVAHPLYPAGDAE
jgi:fatty acid desaturase